MCGIAGWVNFSGKPDEPGVAAMTGAIAHRGPDDRGIWLSPEGVCTFGHARLSIIDLSPLGHQPMLDPETGNAIVFNGEIYNFQDLRRECEAKGSRFRSQSDTEVLLALYRLHGVDCLHRLRGMFAFALWDARRRRIFLARDRVGKKPLNYSLTREGLVFCSEIEPLSLHPAVARAMDSEALELYLQLLYIPAPWTIYRAIRKLPPAHFLLLDEQGLRIERYWEVNYTRKVRISEQAALDGLEDKLTEAVRLRLISDVPIGALLSGGVDSSVIVALMAKLSGEPVRTFSIGFREEAFSELSYAQQAAERCGTIHHPEIVEGDVADLLPHIVRSYGEPFGDSSAVPSFYVSRAAHRHVTVAMNGDGGDELLGGYPRYTLSGMELLLSRSWSGLLSTEQRVRLASRFAAATPITLRAVRKLLTSYLWPELRSVNMYTGYWDDAIRARLLDRGADPDLLPRWRTEWLRGAMAHADNPVERMLWYDNRTYLPGDLLVKMDIASMHCGLETRSPLLDHEVIEYCATLPLDLKVRDRVGKYLLKRLAERYYPREFVHRRKMGFGIPLADWLRGPLRPLLHETLLDAALMEPLSMPVLTDILTSFEAGDDAHQSRLWAAFMYGVWRRRYLEVSA